MFEFCSYELVGICIAAFISGAVFVRHFYRIIQDIKLMNTDNAARFAVGIIPEPGTRPNLFLNRPCREHFGGITR